MLRKRGCSRLLAPALPMLHPNGGQLPGSALHLEAQEGFQLVEDEAAD